MIEMLKLTSIRIDGDTQLRLETSQDVVQGYAQDMRDGDVFPPVVVFHDGTNFWLSDGFHRFFATQEAGKDEIAADIRRGARRDALLHSIEANRKHGLVLNNTDKRRIVTLLLNDPEWSKWSDREIARRCGVSHPFVSSLRSSLEAVTSERVYTTKYGTVATMDVTRIGGNAYEGLSTYVVGSLTERGMEPKDIAEIAKYARSVKADVKGNAAWALLIGSWMLGCKEGDTPKIGDPPYTQEQLEKEGWEMWCLAGKDDLETAFSFGELERYWHEREVKKGKNYLDVTDNDMLGNCSVEHVEQLSEWYTQIVFRAPYTIWHYLTFGLSQEAKDKLTNGEITNLKDAYQYDRDKWDQRYKELVAQVAASGN